MLPWKHHIGCEVCQIALSKSTEKVFFTIVTAVTVGTIMRKIMQPLHHFFLLSQYFWKQLFDTFDNRCDVLRGAFCDSRNVCVTILFSLSSLWSPVPLCNIKHHTINNRFSQNIPSEYSLVETQYSDFSKYQTVSWAQRATILKF